MQCPNKYSITLLGHCIPLDEYGGLKMDKLLPPDEEAFEFQEEDEGERIAEKKNSRVANWVGTWNNPSMTDEEFEKFLTKLYEDDIVTFAVFQREKGEKCGTIHFQFFVTFKSALRFTRVKEILPYGCHFKPMRSTKTRCRNYCSKGDTRVSGPYEIGEFFEERERTDYNMAVRMLNSGFSLREIWNNFPTLQIQYGKKFEQAYMEIHNAEHMSTCRNVEVIYIYGPERVGKTSYVFSQLDNLEDIYQITLFNEYWFTNYQYQKAIFIDEFTGQIRPITKMNKLLEPFPLMLNCKNSFVYAAFEKVYIISNYPLKDVYVAEQTEKKASYDAFCKRINKIIRFDEKGEIHIEKETIWEDIPENERKFKGLTKRASKVYTYDRLGKRTIEYDRETGYQLKLDEELPFDLDKE